MVNITLEIQIAIGSKKLNKPFPLTHLSPLIRCKSWPYSLLTDTEDFTDHQVSSRIHLKSFHTSEKLLCERCWKFSGLGRHSAHPSPIYTDIQRTHIDHIHPNWQIADSFYNATSTTKRALNTLSVWPLLPAIERLNIVDRFREYIQGNIPCSWLCRLSVCSSCQRCCS